MESSFGNRLQLGKGREAVGTVWRIGVAGHRAPLFPVACKAHRLRYHIRLRVSGYKNCVWAGPSNQESPLPLRGQLSLRRSPTTEFELFQSPCLSRMIPTFSFAALMLGMLATVSAAPLNLMESRALPTPVSVATAKTYLAALTIKAEANADTYDRDLFPHWITISGACNTRETVLKRDGTNVVTSSSCAATSGSWYSVYEGATQTSAGNIQIDHLVPLAEAWRSGASGWTTARRQAFANDLTRPQLIAVTGSVNQAKSDSDPAEWMPPLKSYYCTYVRAWIQVKYYYSLSVDQAEYNALYKYLYAC